MTRFFAGTDLIEPGVVPVEEWRPEPGSTQEGKSAWWGAVGPQEIGEALFPAKPAMIMKGLWRYDAIKPSELHNPS